MEQRHFDKALTVVSPRISDQLIQFYQNYHLTSGLQTVWKPRQTQLQSIHTKYPQKSSNQWSKVGENQTRLYDKGSTRLKYTQWSHLTSGLQCEIMLDTLMKPLTKVSHKIPLQVVHRQYEYQVIIVTHTTLQWKMKKQQWYCITLYNYWIPFHHLLWPYTVVFRSGDENRYQLTTV